MVSSRKFYKTEFKITVLSEEPYVHEPVSYQPNGNEPDTFGLDQINYDITNGECSGQVELVSSEQIDGVAAAKALQAQGSDPGFFMLDEGGNDLEEVA